MQRQTFLTVFNIEVKQHSFWSVAGWVTTVQRVWILVCLCTALHILFLYFSFCMFLLFFFFQTLLAKDPCFLGSLGISREMMVQCQPVDFFSSPLVLLNCPSQNLCFMKSFDSLIKCILSGIFIAKQSADFNQNSQIKTQFKFVQIFTARCLRYDHAHI